MVIETVIIPCDRGRTTVCVSSQVGCAMNCQFCYTGRYAFFLSVILNSVVTYTTPCFNFAASLLSKVILQNGS